MALVEIDLGPCLEDSDWASLDNVAKKRLKHIDLSWDALAFCVDYTVKVSYYEEDITDAKEELV